MEIVKITLGQLQSNCYLLKKDKQIIIIDPGDDYYRIKKKIGEDEVVKAIVLTHGHSDHIGAVNDVLKDYDCDVYISLKEKELVNTPSMSFYDGLISKELVYFSHDFVIGDFKFIVHHTPGHTVGSVMFEIEDHLFTGDTLFHMAIGRYDLPTGDINDMKISLDYIKSIDKDYPIYPGHGENSTLAYEKRFNPYLK